MLLALQYTVCRCCNVPVNIINFYIIFVSTAAGCLLFQLCPTVVQGWVYPSYHLFQTPPLLWLAPPTIHLPLPLAVAALQSLPSLLPTRRDRLRRVSKERLRLRLPTHHQHLLRGRGREFSRHHGNQLGRRLLQSPLGVTNCKIPR